LIDQLCDLRLRTGLDGWQPAPTGHDAVARNEALLAA
jgi:hypothetical protein